MKPTVAVFVFSMVMAGCGSSPPSRFFTLSPLAPVGTDETRAPNLPLQVEAVHIPAILDRNAIVTKTDANTVSISKRNRWAAPLDEITQDVLTQDLAERTPQGEVILPNAPAPANTLHLIVNLTQFEEGPEQMAHLQGGWIFVQGQRTWIGQKVNLYTAAGGDEGAAQAAAMSKLLAQLADHIILSLPRVAGE